MLTRVENPRWHAIGERARAIRLAVPLVTKARLNRHIRYEPGDPCPPLVTLGVAFQGVVLVLANTVLMVTIIVRAAGEGELYLAWAVFAALVIAGVTTALQAAHVGRVGAGHILMTGAGPHFIAISVVALTEADLATLVAGCAAALFFGLYDLRALAEASWFDLPDVAAWPGIDLTPDARFWALLPVFVIVSVVAAIKTSSDGAVIQQASSRKPHATDFRLVQGALTASGVGILLSGIAVTPPVIIYLPSSVSLINLTGVAARGVGYAIGGILFALAFLPKLTAVLLSVPSPVMGAFLLIIMGLLFVEGIRTVFQDGLDPQKGLVVGVALALGVGLESGSVFEGVLGATWSASVGNGMTVGVLATVLLTGFLELTSSRRRRLDVELDVSASAGIDDFLRRLAGRSGWNDASSARLRGAGEEALECLLQLRGGDAADRAPRLILFARPGRETVEMEFLVVAEKENIEDHLTYLSERAETPEESELSFRLLRHYASSVRHRQYHGIEIVTVKVAGSR